MQKFQNRPQIELVDSQAIISRINSLNSDTILLVTDEYFWSLYQNELDIEGSLNGKKLYVWIAPAGEKTKNFKKFEECTEFFLNKGIHRNTHLVALGGGALSDFAGFVASSLLRGIPWSVIPTTLLSMIDASIGGKVGINSESGKNLIGSFYNPQNIWVNYSFIKTQSKEEILSAKGEILKYAFLDKDVCELIQITDLENDLHSIIKACATFKLKIVEEDFREKGKRKILNLGHTMGHPLEKIYSLPHGVAVMWGMALFFKMIKDEKNLTKLSSLKKALNWPVSPAPWKNNFPFENFSSFLEKDKKITGFNRIDLILPTDVRDTPRIMSFSLSELTEYLRRSETEIRNFTF